MSVSVLIIGPGRCDMTGSLIARDRRQLPKDTLLSRQRRRCACNADPLQRLRSHVLLISNRGTHRVLRYTLGTGVHTGYWGTHRIMRYTPGTGVHNGVLVGGQSGTPNRERSLARLRGGVIKEIKYSKCQERERESKEFCSSYLQPFVLDNAATSPPPHPV